MKKYILIILVVSMALMLFVFIPKTEAKPKDNPFLTALAVLEENFNQSLGEIQTDLNSLADRVTQNESDITDLQVLSSQNESDIGALSTDVSQNSTDIDYLMGEINEPLDVVFFDDVDILTTSSQKSEWFDSGNYSELVFTYQCKAYTSTSEYGASINLLVSNDMNTTATVFAASKAECHSGGTVDISVAGKYYQVLVGSNSNIVDPPMTVFAIGRFK